MLRLLIIAHDPLASAFKAVAGHLFPDAADSINVCDVQAHQSQDDIARLGAQALERMGGGDVLILTDVFGASPCNVVAERLAQRHHTRVVSGLNVPALWRALAHLHDPLDEVAELVVAGGRQGVMHVTCTPSQPPGPVGCSA